MEPEHWRKVDSLFKAAFERPAEERAPFLEEACGNDASLRDLLLVACEQSTKLKEAPAMDRVRLLLDWLSRLPVLKVGDRVGRYEILSRVGAGGMGEVYVASDPELRRKVAIKVLTAAFAADKKRVRSFYDEGRLASALNHPNILTVYDLVETSERPYLVTEYVEGQTLRQRLGHGRVPTQEAIRIASQVASALEASHAAGILHRDIKPENLMLRPDGLVKVLDFGIAKVLPPPAGNRTGSDPTTVETGPGKIAGSISYMAPEQVAGHNLDARTDLWSTGVVLYEMLTGRSPFCMPAGNAPIATVIHKILNEDPPPVQELAPEVPAWVARILERCLEKNPNHRFQTMAQLKSALQQASAVSVAQSGLHKRNVLLLTATIIIILAIAAVARRFGTGPAAPPSFRSLTYSGRDFSPAVSPDGRTIAFTSDRDGPPRIWLKQINGAEVPLTAGPDDAPRFSPDATTVLFVRREGAYTSLFTIPVVGGEPRRLVEDVIGADFSPDGAQIGLIRWQNSPEFTGSVFATIKSDGSEPVKELVRVSLKQLQMPRWSPDGSHIASVHSIAAFGSEIVVVTRDGQVSVLDPQTELAISGPAWLSSGQHLVYVRGDYAGSSKSDLVRHSLRSKELTILHTAWPHESRCLDIVGNGRVIFDTSSRRSNLREIPLHGGTGRWLTRGTSMDRQPVFSPDGERVAFTSDRSGNTDIWQMDLGSRQLARLVDHPADDLDPAYTPDGKGIIWTSGRSGHFEIYLADRDGGRPRRVTNDGVDAQNATMTRDGRWIVYVSSHPVNKGIWKIRPDGSAAARLASGTHFNPEVSPDGKYSLYITSVHPAVNVIRVVRIEDGVQEPFEIACEIRRPTRVVIGRARWNSNNQTIVFIGQDENGVHGIFEQPFAPGKDTSRFRRRVGAFDPDTTTESFEISRDGKLIVASWDQLWTLIIADQIPGITYRRQNAP